MSTMSDRREDYRRIRHRLADPFTSPSSRPTVCFQDVDGHTRGAIGDAIAALLLAHGYTIVSERDTNFEVGICTAGRLSFPGLPNYVGRDDRAGITALYESNYLQPVLFIERMVARLIAQRTLGLIIVLGSNSSWYGAQEMGHYSSMKAALRKYCELEGKALQCLGVRLCHLALGAVETHFWDKAKGTGMDPIPSGTYRENVVDRLRPHKGESLTVEDVAAVVQSIIELPPRVVLRDSLIVSEEHQ